MSSRLNILLITLLSLLLATTVAFAAFDPCDGYSWARPCTGADIGGFHSRVDCCAMSCENYCHTGGVALSRTYCTNRCTGQ